MPRKCTLCAHSNRNEIDRALINNESYRNIAVRFNVSTAALLRHKQSHLAASLTKAKNAKEVTKADSLLGELERLRAEARRIAAKAEDAEDYRTALAGIRELTRIIELLAKMQGELKDQTVNILVNPQWITLRAEILRTLEPYPEARIKLAEALSYEERVS